MTVEELNKMYMELQEAIISMNSFDALKCLKDHLKSTIDILDTLAEADADELETETLAYMVESMLVTQILEINTLTKMIDYFKNLAEEEN